MSDIKNSSFFFHFSRKVTSGLSSAQMACNFINRRESCSEEMKFSSILYFYRIDLFIELLWDKNSLLHNSFSFIIDTDIRPSKTTLLQSSWKTTMTITLHFRGLVIVNFLSHSFLAVISKVIKTLLEHMVHSSFSDKHGFLKNTLWWFEIH